MYCRRRVSCAGGLGAAGDIDPASPECPQPVSTGERDSLRAELEQMEGYFGQRPWGQHWHEGHPDVRAWLADLMPRVDGLYHRPKLLRCSAEARKKAREWISTWKWVGSQIRSEKSFLRGGSTSVPKGGLLVHTYNMRDYFLREGNPSGFVPGSAEEAANKPPQQAVPKEEGVPFPGGGATAPAPTATTGGKSDVVPTAEGGYAVTSPAGFSMEGSVAGIPTKYLVYGGLALVAMKMLKGR